MKQIINFKTLALLFAVVLGLGVISCDNDDDVIPTPSVNVEDVNGNYSGKLTTTQGQTKNETSTTFVAKNSVISFTALPVKEIVGSIIKDPVKAEAALKKIGNVKYDFNYSAKVNNARTAVDLTFTPKELEIQVPIDDANKKVIATFTSKQTGSYTGKDKSISFELSVDKITLEGTAVTPFEAIKYSSKSEKK